MGAAIDAPARLALSEGNQILPLCAPKLSKPNLFQVYLCMCDQEKILIEG